MSLAPKIDKIRVFLQYDKVDIEHMLNAEKNQWTVPAILKSGNFLKKTGKCSKFIFLTLFFIRKAKNHAFFI